MPAPTVFISYSHNDEEWKKKLLPHLAALEQAGISMEVWHDRKIDGGDKWYPEIVEAMSTAAVAILLVSADFLASKFCIQEEVPALLKRQADQGMLLIPVLVRQCPWKTHRWLSELQMIPRDGKCVAIDFAGDHADAVFTAVAEQVHAHFITLSSRADSASSIPEAVQSLPSQADTAETAKIVPPPAVIKWRALPEDRIDLTRLPETGSALFGRDEELALLDEAWASQDRTNAPPTRVLAFTAYGGVGKSTLVNTWLAEMKRDHFRGSTRVFGWSFYSQGVREESVASGDSFIDAALRFFGDAAPTTGSPWDKGSRLARLVGDQRALLVLDGLEPLQSPHDTDRGKLRDASLESLLRGLARNSSGLCLISTREPLPDIAGRPGVMTRDLEQITAQAGRALLRTLHVVGTDAELEHLASRFGPHALAISLLGVYLREQPGHGIGPAAALESLPGKQPIDRVLAAFEQWLGDGPECDALRLLGFFDRPADFGCLDAIRQAPTIPGLTDHLVGQSDSDWDRTLARLERLRLIHVQRGRQDRGFVDAHPLIREHFAQQLREGRSPSWSPGFSRSGEGTPPEGGTPTRREGHRRLYEHLCASTQEGDQPTLEALQPLYQAVAHGCQAGLQQEACDDVYFARILRPGQQYSLHKLGAFGMDLGAIASFFDAPWTRISGKLTEADRAWILGQTAACLRSLGRLPESLEAIRAGQLLFEKQEDWKRAAINASNLSELELTLGEVAGAVGDAEQSVTYADRSGDAFQRMGQRTTHADALHQAGRRAEAEARFREAEQMQAEDDSAYPLLYSLRGFQYCDLLLAEAERAAWQKVVQGFSPTTRTKSEMGTPREKPTPDELKLGTTLAALRAVSERAAQTLKWMQADSGAPLLTIALDHLTLGRAALYAALLSSDTAAPSSFIVPTSSLDSAVSGLRRAATQDHIPLGLLTRAWLRFLTGPRNGPESAQSDLDEAWEIAERGPMPLFMADIHLHRARLFGKRLGEEEKGRLGEAYPWESPQHDLAEARRLIVKHGYLRRMPELEDAEPAIQ